jgi:uncharacterized protein (DUF362 family)
MKIAQKSTVAILRCKDYDNIAPVKEKLNELLNMIGGLESIVNPGDKVLIKPNLLGEYHYKTGATTNPNLIFALAELCREVGVKHITVADGAGIGNDTDKVYDALGIRELCRKHHCHLVDLTKDEFRYFINPMAKNMKRIRLPKTFIEANVVINLPVMKTHDALFVTLGLKNMKGLVHPSDKKRFHKWGLAQNVADLGYLAMPELTIMDATVAMEGLGPVAGRPVNLGLLLASVDTLAVDRAAMEIMGYDLSEVEYIRIAGEQGLGCTDLNKINIIGEKLTDVIRPFDRVTLDLEKLKSLGIKIAASAACSGCNNAISSYLTGLDNQGKLEVLKDTTIIYGQNSYIPEDTKNQIIRLGVCAKKIGAGIYVPGCPPHPCHINDFLDGKGFE